MYLILQMCFVKGYYVAQMYCLLSACFLNMCFVYTCAFYLRIKSRWCDWRKNSAHKWITQRVYSFIIYSCGGPAVARKRKKRKGKNPLDSEREPEMSVWLYIVKICSERRLCECSNRLTHQIFITRINIREEICYCITAYLNRVCENSTYLDNTDM
jgi:hypothetical protein